MHGPLLANGSYFAAHYVLILSASLLELQAPLTPHGEKRVLTANRWQKGENKELTALSFHFHNGNHDLSHPIHWLR